MTFAYSGDITTVPWNTTLTGHMAQWCKEKKNKKKKEKTNQVLNVQHCKDDYVVSWPIITSPFRRSVLTLPPNQDEIRWWICRVCGLTTTTQSAVGRSCVCSSSHVDVSLLPEICYKIGDHNRGQIGDVNLLIKKSSLFKKRACRNKQLACSSFMVVVRVGRLGESLHFIKKCNNHSSVYVCRILPGTGPKERVRADCIYYFYNVLFGWWEVTRRGKVR